MKILYIVGANLRKNTSANMSHNAFIQGIIENGHKIDIIMAKDSWGEKDDLLPCWKVATYYEYKSETPNIKIKKILSKFLKRNNVAPSNNVGNADTKTTKKYISLRGVLKKIYYKLFPQDPVYPLEATWIKNASQFKSNQVYDVVISNSSPAASHKLANTLISSGRIKCNRWIQIWEDPWYYDLYGGHTEKEKEEEHTLLREATEIYYVSPLTLKYQKEYFKDCAYKMECIPLPFLKIDENDNVEEIEEMSFGYFGDYYSQTRNLVPFYDALKETGVNGYIYGDTDLNLTSTDMIEVSGRVTLDILSKIQDKTNVLVHLCNLKGGQIPGKIYHYSSTNKAILFILDGTEEEKKVIKDFFGKFERYFFCENEKSCLKAAIIELEKRCKDYTGSIVQAFEPKNVVANLLKEEGNM